MEDSVIAGAMIGIIAGGGAWLRTHEARISASEAIIKKIDTLVDLLIAEKLQEKD
jgi:hypothetical protein